MVHKLEQLQKSQEVILTDQQDRLRKFQEDIESTVQDVLNRVQSLDNANLLATSSDLESTLAALEKPPHPVLELKAQPKQFVPVFSFDDQTVQDAIKKLGTVSNQGDKSEEGRPLLPLLLMVVSLFAVCLFIYFLYFYVPSNYIAVAIMICFFIYVVINQS